MNGLSWGLAAPAAAVLGILALVAWFALAPPRRRPSAALRAGAALLLVFALLDVGCRLGAGARAPRVVVVVDRSLSMRVADREARANEWLERLERSLAEWRVERESFGGATTDLVEAIARAEARLPEAIVLVSDGRAAGGRAAEAPAVPLYVHAPEPLDVEDLAVIDLATETVESGGVVVEVETAAVGGRSTAARPIVVLVDGRVSDRSTGGPPYQAGERRTTRLELGSIPDRAVVEARLEGADAVAGNDARARVAAPGAGAGAALLVALRPAWEFGFVRRSLEAAAQAPVDAMWAPAPGRLTPLDRTGPASWAALSTERYRTAWVFGDPALLGEEGGAWLRRFVARGGRGILWAPGGHAGSLAGVGAVVPSGARASALPELTQAGARWLVAHGGPLEEAPDGTPGWTPLELLPDLRAIPAGATLLLEAGGRPAAWIAERGTSRVAVLLGTGYYRWRLSGEERPREFWDGWIATLSRWLSAAEAADPPLVRMPLAGRISAVDTLAVAVAAEGDLAWRIERAAGGRVAEGVVGGSEERTVRGGPLAPGVYRLVAEAQGRREVEPFVVETWAPDLAWTAADTASLARAARTSGGGVLGAAPRLPSPVRATETVRGGRTFALGTTVWTYFAVVVLLLLDWGFGARSRLRLASSADPPG